MLTKKKETSTQEHKNVTGRLQQEVQVTEVKQSEMSCCSRQETHFMNSIQACKKKILKDVNDIRKY